MDGLERTLRLASDADGRRQTTLGGIRWPRWPERRDLVWRQHDTSRHKHEVYGCNASRFIMC